MTQSHFFEGQLLLAMTGVEDDGFNKSVIYLCSHDESGAMGLIINQSITSIDFDQLMEQLDIDTDGDNHTIPIHSGGPVEPGRGFVLHSADYVQDSTLVVSETVALTATVDILSAIARGEGPKNHLIALGYAGWGPGQLENEIQNNVWLTTKADDEIIFHTDLDKKWLRAMAMMGIDSTMLALEPGHC